MSDVFVAGVAMTPFGRHTDKTLDALAGEALEAVLADAGGDRGAIEIAYYSGATNGQLQDQHFIPGQVVLGKAGLEGLPIVNVENACASGSTAFHLAVQSVRSGAADLALAIGAEKMVVPDKAKMFSVFDAGWDVVQADANRQTLLALGEGIVPPEGSESPKPYSVFMAVYAAFCRNHMKQFGTTQRQIASIAAKNHQHSVHNPKAQFRNAYSTDEILAAPPITYPLTLPMCAPISDGAAAALVASPAGLQRLGFPRRRAVQVAASVMGSATGRTAEEPHKHCAHLAALKAYEAAGLGPEDVHVAEVHDATAMGELIHVENLGLVPFGESGPAAERGEFSLGGRVPVNPSGGLESKGHPIGVTGLGQIFELVTQLRGEAGARQVEGARIAAHENSGGLRGIEEAAVVINLLKA